MNVTKLARHPSDTNGNAEILLSRSLGSEADMSRAVNVLALVRDGQKYIFLYDDNSVQQVMSQLAEFAADPELDFTWYDAATLSQRVRDLQSEEADSETEDFPSFF